MRVGILLNKVRGEEGRGISDQISPTIWAGGGNNLFYNVRWKMRREERRRMLMKLGGELDLWFHITGREALRNILNEGLKVGIDQEEWGGFTVAGNWAEEWYGVWPIFLSRQPWVLKEKDLVLLRVNIAGLRRAADLPSLIDSGGYLGEEGCIHWGGDIPGPLEGLDQDGEFWIEDFLTDESLIQAAIKLTGTVAVLDNIDRDRIEVIDW